MHGDAIFTSRRARLRIKVHYYATHSHTHAHIYYNWINALGGRLAEKIDPAKVISYSDKPGAYFNKITPVNPEERPKA